MPVIKGEAQRPACKLLTRDRVHKFKDFIASTNKSLGITTAASPCPTFPVTAGKARSALAAFPTITMSFPFSDAKMVGQQLEV
jgi:hypothetical protein